MDLYEIEIAVILIEMIGKLNCCNLRGLTRDRNGTGRGCARHGPHYYSPLLLLIIGLPTIILFD
jgi:hypothetical protein